MTAFSIPNDRHYRYRHERTADLLAERESREWEACEIMADLERDPTSWASPASTLSYVLTALEDVTAELRRRERLRFRADAPAWPRRDPNRYANLIALADELKRLWPVDRFCREMLLLDLERRGRQLWARCPLPGHDDRTASFAIDPTKNVWYCHGACHHGGDVFALIGFLRGADRFVDQVRILADVAGVTGPEEARDVG